MNKINRLGLIIILLCIFSIAAIVPVTYTLYKEGKNVSIRTVTGKLIYDVSLDEDPTYLDPETNNPYFFVTIKNNNIMGLTDADFDYNITIKNKNDSIGLFSYVQDNNELSEQSSVLNITGSLGKTAPEEKTYKVIVTSNSYDEETVLYDVSYDISQKRMEND